MTRQEYQKKYREKNKEKLALYRKEHYNRNKEKVAKISKAYYQNNKAKIIKKVTQYTRLKRQTCDLKKASDKARACIQNAFKNKKQRKNTKTEAILGCTFIQFKAYIETQFRKGMSWENKNLWHLDHIKPVATATNVEEILKLNHYTNFQPLWAHENLSKAAKLNWVPDKEKHEAKDY